MYEHTIGHFMYEALNRKAELKLIDGTALTDELKQNKAFIEYRMLRLLVECIAEKHKGFSLKGLKPNGLGQSLKLYNGEGETFEYEQAIQQIRGEIMWECVHSLNWPLVLPETLDAFQAKFIADIKK